jgi:suppressor for copper-sensitivity B
MKKTFTIFFCLLAFSTPAFAENSAQGNNIQGTLVTTYDQSNGLTPLPMAIDITMADGWYTYWRMAGDNGVATSIDWKNSSNVKDVTMRWPAPSRYTTMDMSSFGYSGNVVFPLDVTPLDPAKDMAVDLTMNFVVCHDICVPEILHMDRVIKAGKLIPSDGYETVQKSNKALPSDKNTKSLGIDTAVLGKESVIVMAYAKAGFAKGADLIVETPNAVLTAVPEIIPDESDKTKAMFKIKAAPGLDLSKELFGKTVTLVLINGKDAVERPFSF